MTRFGGVAEARTAKPYTSEDFRFMTKGDVLYAIALEWPTDGRLRIRSLASPTTDRKIKYVYLLGTPALLKWAQTADALEIELPPAKPCDYAYALKIESEQTSSEK
jgi:alpha-L-fucosidase